MRRTLIGLLFCLLALAAPALFAKAGGFFSPLSGNIAPEPHVTSGSDGPMNGLWEDALEGDYTILTTFEDFDSTFPDLSNFGAIPNEWPNSGFTVTGINTPVGGAHARMRGASLLVDYAGTGASDSVNITHNGLRSMSLDPTASTSRIFSLFDMPSLLMRSVGYYANLSLRFSTRMIITNSGAWNSAIAFGLAATDTQLMVNTTGSISGGAPAWSTEGILFHISQACILSINVRNAAGTLTSRTIDLAVTNPTFCTNGTGSFFCGFTFDPAIPNGDGTLQAYYKVTDSHLVPWLPLGAPITGSVFPTVADFGKYHVEVNNHATTPRAALAYIWYVASAQRKEGARASY